MTRGVYSKVWAYFLTVVVVFALGLMFCGPVRAQVSGATLSGAVTDPSQAAVPNAQVTIRNTATGVTREITTDSAGLYSAPNLLPGPYEVTVTAPGFSAAKMPAIQLAVGAQQTLNVPMSIGATTQTVEVTSAAPIIDLTSTAISATVAQTTVVELPLNGRDWTQLATLQPSVDQVYTQQPNGANANRGNRGFGNQLTISGTRPQLNNYRVDGISVVDYAGGGPGSVLGIALGVDAVQEFSVLTSNYSAEYGRTSGGVVNAITRSGANNFHGDGYFFTRSSKWDARNPKDRANIAPFHRDQFGGSVGGPIQKDKSFFFVDYEGFRQALGITNNPKVPSDLAKSGTLYFASTNPPGAGVNPPAGCTQIGSTNQCTVTVNPTIIPYLQFYPEATPGTVGPNSNIGSAFFATNAAGTEDFVTSKLDHKLSGKDSLSGTFYYDKGLLDVPDAQNNILNGNISRRQMYMAEETHIFSPSLVNSVRGGFDRVFTYTNQAIQAINPKSADLSLGTFPGRAASGFTIPGTAAVNAGEGAVSHPIHTWNSFQGYDDAFLTKGAHSIKFGFAVERMQHDLLVSTRANGTWNYGSMANFLQNIPLSFQGQQNLNPVAARQTLFGGYVQDDWKLRPNLTVNLGLRYEMVTVPTDAQGRTANFRSFTATAPVQGNPYFNNPTKRNFEPRVGLAWDPFGDGKTSVRAAFGVFDVLPLNYVFFLAEAFQYPYAIAISTNQLTPNPFPAPPTVANPSDTSKLQVASIEFNPHRNYVMIWNLNVQRQLTTSTSLTVGYVGNHGVHMIDREDDMNSVIPTQTSAGLLFPYNHTGTRLNPLWGDMRGVYWDGNSLYDALEVGVQKKMSHGLQMQASYTWSKNIDSGSASVIGDPFTNSISSLPFFCNFCRRGLSDFNIAQSLVVNYIWEAPTPHNLGAVAEHLLGGWQVGGILTVQTGVPITPLIGGDPNGLNSTDPYAFPNRVAGTGCSDPAHPWNAGDYNHYINLNCFTVPMQGSLTSAQCTPYPAVPGSCRELMGTAGRNTIIGPGLVDWDFSLFKNNYIRRISETFNLQLRAEIFNVLNHANWNTPVETQTLFNSDGSPSSNGAVESTSTTSRQMQFAIKVIF